MILQFSAYHKILRISSAVCAIVLLFQAGLVSHTTALLATNTQLYLANAVGVTVGVAPTEINQITAELTKKTTELKQREELLHQREIAVEPGSNTSALQDRSTFILGSVLFILLVLIVLNYVLDFVRSKRLLVTKYVTNKSQNI